LFVSGTIYIIKIAMTTKFRLSKFTSYIWWSTYYKGNQSYQRKKIRKFKYNIFRIWKYLYY